MEVHAAGGMSGQLEHASGRLAPGPWVLVVCVVGVWKDGPREGLQYQFHSQYLMMKIEN